MGGCDWLEPVEKVVWCVLLRTYILNFWARERVKERVNVRAREIIEIESLETHKNIGMITERGL